MAISHHFSSTPFHGRISSSSSSSPGRRLGARAIRLPRRSLARSLSLSLSESARITAEAIGTRWLHPPRSSILVSAPEHGERYVAIESALVSYAIGGVIHSSSFYRRYGAEKAGRAPRRDISLFAAGNRYLIQCGCEKRNENSLRRFGKFRSTRAAVFTFSSLPPFSFSFFLALPIIRCEEEML